MTSRAAGILTQKLLPRKLHPPEYHSAYYKVIFHLTLENLSYQVLEELFSRDSVSLDPNQVEKTVIISEAQDQTLLSAQLQGHEATLSGIL